MALPVSGPSDEAPPEANVEELVDRGLLNEDGLPLGR